MSDEDIQHMVQSLKSFISNEFEIYHDKLDKFNRRVDGLDNKVTQLESRFKEFEISIMNVFRDMGSRFDKTERRLGRLENSGSDL